MDERDLEARLAARLHARFDAVQPPERLVAAVQAGFVEPRPRWQPRFSGARSVLGFAGVVAAVVVIAVLGSNVRPPAGSSPSASMDTTPAPITDRHFIVLPPLGAIPTKPESSAASEILSERLRALHPEWSFSSAGGDAITFDVPTGDDDATVRAVLSATGDIAFVPLPPADYGNGKATAVVGQPLPVKEPALFGWEGIASASLGTDQQGNTRLSINLKPAAAEALGTYTAANIGQASAILVDGRVALLPFIQSSIQDGALSITPGSLTDPDFKLFAAIVQSAPLPESWRNPRVPVVMNETQARRLALAAAGSSVPAAVTSAQLGTTGTPASSTGVVAVWQFGFAGSFSSSCGGGPLPEGVTPGPCAPASTELVTLDAVTGAVVEISAPAP